MLIVENREIGKDLKEVIQAARIKFRVINDMYAEKLSMLLDVRLFVRTVWYVLFHIEIREGRRIGKTTDVVSTNSISNTKAKSM